jgi:hypothetical protein
MDEPRREATAPSTMIPGRVVGAGSLLLCIGLLSFWLALDMRGEEDPLGVLKGFMWLGIASVVVGSLFLAAGWWWLRRRMQQRGASRAALAGALLGMVGYVPTVLWLHQWFVALGLVLGAAVVALAWYGLRRSAGPGTPP